MFEHALASGRLIRPFLVDVAAGSYWLTRLKSKPQTEAGRAFVTWLVERLRDTLPTSGDPLAPGAR